MFVASGVMYFVVMGIYLWYVWLEDKRALIFNDTWLYDKKEVIHTTGEKQNL